MSFTTVPISSLSASEGKLGFSCCAAISLGSDSLECSRCRRDISSAPKISLEG